MHSDSQQRDKSSGRGNAAGSSNIEPTSRSGVVATGEGRTVTYSNSERKDSRDKESRKVQATGYSISGDINYQQVLKPLQESLSQIHRVLEEIRKQNAALLQPRSFFDPFKNLIEDIRKQNALLSQQHQDLVKRIEVFVTQNSTNVALLCDSKTKVPEVKEEQIKTKPQSFISPREKLEKAVVPALSFVVNSENSRICSSVPKYLEDYLKIPVVEINESVGLLPSLVIYVTTLPTERTQLWIQIPRWLQQKVTEAASTQLIVLAVTTGAQPFCIDYKPYLLLQLLTNVYGRLYETFENPHNKQVCDKFKELCGKLSTEGGRGRG